MRVKLGKVGELRRVAPRIKRAARMVYGRPPLPCLEPPIWRWWAGLRRGVVAEPPLCPRRKPPDGSMLVCDEKDKVSCCDVPAVAPAKRVFSLTNESYDALEFLQREAFRAEGRVRSKEELLSALVLLMARIEMSGQVCRLT